MGDFSSIFLRQLEDGTILGAESAPELAAIHHLISAAGDISAETADQKAAQHQPPESPNSKMALAMIRSALDDVRRVVPPNAIGVPKSKQKNRTSVSALDVLIDNASQRKLAMWARWWFENPRARGDLITLGWCCDVLGVESEFVQTLARPLYGKGMPRKKILMRTASLQGSLGGKKRRVKA